jgi:glycosyltransferase involved in cell wall biosynthesis
MTPNPVLTEPLVSIVLPTMNGAQFIGDTIDSILNQTLENFELIIIDDGSTDNTAVVVKRYTDPRIRVVFQENEGVCKATNRGYSMARGKYLSRHDHDDISLPTRFEKQVQFLEAHPETAFVGCWAQIWSEGKPTDRIHRHPTTPGYIAFSLLFNSPFVHTACLLRKEVFELTGGYTLDPDRIPPEDYECFSRISRSFAMANIPECLVIYQEVVNSMSSMLRTEQSPAKKRFVSNLVRISSENLAFAAGLQSTDHITNDFGALTHQGYERLPAKYHYTAMRELVIQAAKDIAIRFHEPSVLILLKEKLLWLDYQYHTQQGNTYHWIRLKYLYLNRPFHENFGSIGRLFNKCNPFRAA